MSTNNRKAANRILPKALVADVRREFAFSDADFRSLAQLAHDHAGIVLHESKHNMVYGRLSFARSVIKYIPRVPRLSRDA
jgi:hypothetical protein